MKKQFNIKNLSIIIFTFICMFLLTNNVKAGEKYVCYYKANLYSSSVDELPKYGFDSISDVYLKVVNENNITTLSYYNAKTKELKKQYSEFSLIISGDSEESFSTYYSKKITPSSFANGCPISIDTYFLNGGGPDIDGAGTGNGLVFCFNCIDNYEFADKWSLEVPNGQSNELPSTGGNGQNNKDQKICNYSNPKLLASNSEIITHFSLIYTPGVEGTIQVSKKISGSPDATNANFDIENLGDECPNYIYSNSANTNFYLDKNEAGDGYNSYSLKKQIFLNDGSKQLSGGDVCSTGLEKFIKAFYSLLRYIVPLLIVVFSVIEFVGVVLSGEQEKMEKAKKRFAIRLVVGILVLFIPALLELILNLAGIIDGDLSKIVCGIL